MNSFRFRVEWANRVYLGGREGACDARRRMRRRRRTGVAHFEPARCGRARVGRDGAARHADSPGLDLQDRGWGRLRTDRVARAAMSNRSMQSRARRCLLDPFCAWHRAARVTLSGATARSTPWLAPVLSEWSRTILTDFWRPARRQRDPLRAVGVVAAQKARRWPRHAESKPTSLACSFACR
jgi:hypothetical protein